MTPKEQQNRLAELLQQAYDELPWTGRAAPLKDVAARLIAAHVRVDADPRDHLISDEQDTYNRGYLAGAAQEAQNAALRVGPDEGLRAALAQAIEGGWQPSSIDLDLYHNDPVFHAVVYTIQYLDRSAE